MIIEIIIKYPVDSSLDDCNIELLYITITSKIHGTRTVVAEFPIYLTVRYVHI